MNKTALASAITAISIGMFAVTSNAQQLAIEEVVVTAQKKEESLQDTPIAISAFTSDNLKDIGAFGAVDVGEYTPNARITRSLGSSFNIRVAIRGTGTAEPSLAVDPKVGVYLDGAYVARNAGAVFDIVDLERVEVLRGPQGTLWGKNTTGGAMSLITQQPSGEFGGKVDLTAGNFGMGRALVSVDTNEMAGMAAKFSYMMKVNDGWQDQHNPTSEDELGSEDIDAMRLALRWDVSDTFYATYAFDRTEGDATAPATQVAWVDADTSPNVLTVELQPPFNLFTGNAFADMAAIATDDDRIEDFYLDDMQKEEVEINGHNLTLSWLLGDLEIKSITSYRDYESDQKGLDLDGGTWQKFALGTNEPSTATIFHTSGTKEQDQFSQEFQFLGSAFDDRLDYVVGLYYFEEDGEEINPWLFTVYNAANGANFWFNETMGGWYEVENESAAIYGQGSWYFNDAWRLTVGARYTEDDKKLTLLEEDPGLDMDYTADESWDEFTGMVTLTYFLDDDINFYGKIAEGYAAGIYNPSTVGRGAGPADPSAALVPADPEETTSYELGMKSRFADGRIQLNAAIFYNDNENLQRTDFVDGIRRTINSGESETEGIELDLIALISENWTLAANYGYADTDFDEGDTTPFKSGAASLQYENQADYGLWNARLDTTYMGKTGFSASDPRVGSESRYLYNARLSLSEVDAFGGQLRVSLWGKNLADEEYVEHGANYGSYVGYTFGLPRTYGIDLTYEF
jgi:iron complex outermembrane receptor protein